MVISVSVAHDSFSGGFSVFVLDVFFEFKPVKGSKAHWLNDLGALVR